MRELAKAVYLEDVLLGKSNSKERFEIESMVELADRLTIEELVNHVNTHLQSRMFMVGQCITAADIAVHLRIAAHFRGLMDFQKIELPHAFRWIDHIQHLPGMAEQVADLGLFVSFPNENSEGPSKAQLKKLAKQQYQKEQKEKKQAGDPKEGGDQKGAAKEESKGGNAEQKPQKQKQQKQQPKKAEPAKNLPDLSKLDIRVGKIVWVEKNPASDKLYNEKIDLGNGDIREIASGLQKHLTLEQMQDAMVVVICNLKARKLAGYKSHGMVLCAQTADESVIELLQPPAGSEPGDPVTFEGFERAPLEQLPNAKNPWDAVHPRFTTDDSLQGCFKTDDGTLVPFMTPKGVCKASTVKHGLIK